MRHSLNSFYIYPGSLPADKHHHTPGPDCKGTAGQLPLRQEILLKCIRNQFPTHGGRQVR